MLAWMCGYGMDGEGLNTRVVTDEIERSGKGFIGGMAIGRAICTKITG